MTEIERLTEKVRANRFSPVLSVTTNLQRMIEAGSALKAGLDLLGEKKWREWVEAFGIPERIVSGMICLATFVEVTRIYIEDEEDVIILGMLSIIKAHQKDMKLRSKK